MNSRTFKSRIKIIRLSSNRSIIVEGMRTEGNLKGSLVPHLNVIV